MSLEVRLKCVTNLKGKYDRFARLVFRGVPYLSKVLPNCGNDAFFDQIFVWPMSSFLDPEEFFEVRIFNRNKIFQDRLVGAYRLSLAALVAQGILDVVDNLIAFNHHILRQEIKIELKYLKPCREDFYETEFIGNGSANREDTRSHISIGSRATAAEIPGLGSKGAAMDLLQDKELYHPRIRQPKIVNSMLSDWQLQVRIIEAKDLAGMSLDPVITIIVGEQRKNTTVKPQTNNPLWDEFFCFDFRAPYNQIMDSILMFQVFTGRNIVSQGTIIGSFKLDLGYIYEQLDHCLFSKWAPLLDGATTECKGFVRLDLSVFGKGDIQKDPPVRKENDDDIENNLILPKGILPYRPVYKYVVKVYKADGIPQMNTNIMANVKKAFTRKVRDLADPFIEVSFCGMKGKTSVVKNSYSPEFNEQIIFTEFFPPLCKKMQIQLKDSDAVSEEVIGTHYINFNEISNNDPKMGYLPVFGPSWINLYGSTRDYNYSDEHVELNNGLGEGISYRGRVLLAIDCFEGEPEETGFVELDKLDPLPPKIIGKEEIYQLFATFYEANMIPRKIGDKPIQFEVTIGEFGVFLDAQPSKETKPPPPKAESLENEESDNESEDEEYVKEKVYVQSLTAATRPFCPEKKYYHVPWEGQKPCAHVKFPFEDQRRRHYNNAMIEKMYNTLEENLEELDARVRLQLPGTFRLFRRFMGDMVHGCSLYIKLADGKQTGTHLGKNRLDKERLKICLFEMKGISLTAARFAAGAIDDTDIDDKVKSAHSMFRRMRKILIEPQHGLPDIFVWMLSGGKRVAYTRIPAHDVLHSKVDWERGPNAGRVQTIFLRLPGKRGHGVQGWAIQAKVEIRIWLGLLKHKSDYLMHAPSGFEMPEDALSMLSCPPDLLCYTEKQSFIVRAHVYQARSLIGSDDSGLSDAFARVICTNKAMETQVVWETRSPTWDQMLKFEGIQLWGDVAELAVNPPVIVIEIFDKDEGGDCEFIGRALAKPVVKLAEEKYEKPFFPPILQWFPIYRGEDRAGELLAAFEMLELSDELMTELPPDPETTVSPEGVKMCVPDGVRPIMVKHRVEVLFWGVREMKRCQLMNINRPQADVDCCYPVTRLDGKTEQYVKSTVCRNAAKNPNFDDPVIIFDVDLPDNKEYIPPVTIRVNDCRAFGRLVLVGTHVIDSLTEYFMDPASFYKKTLDEPAVEPGKKGKGDDVPLEIPDEEPEQADAGVEKKKKKKEEAEKEEEILDWWTRFYETLRDKIPPAKEKKKLGFGVKKKDTPDTPSKPPDPKEERIPRLTVFDNELEEEETYNGFNDFIRTFILLRGKKTEEENDEEIRFSGKFKGNIRVWKYPLPETFEPENPKGSYQKLPVNDPINVLVRVYIIKCLNLHPTDPNGKADPYLVVTLGKKTYKDRDNYVSKQLCPEFGRVFEFEAVFPMDNLLNVQVYDWDMLSGDDLIGEAKFDIENRFFSRHRPSCGIQENYTTHGYAKWRDPQKPSQILTKLCKDEGLEGPSFNEGVCTVQGMEFIGNATIKDAKGREKPSDEPAALTALRQFHEIPKKGYPLCPEHIETRSLLNPEKPGIEQGRVQLWVDMFPMELTIPGPAIDVSPRKPEDYELRIVIWNTEDVLPDETNIITGEASSDIYVKGWLEGNREFIQQTDVHYRSSDGSGMFNWRFIFQFMFHKAEEKIVTRKKASFFSVDLTEEKHPCNLYLQVWDADLLSADDFIGDVILPLTKMPVCAKSAKACGLDQLSPDHPTASLIKAKLIKGWWPFQVNPEDDDSDDPILAGKVEAEMELLIKVDAEATPAGRAREEPQPLTKPNRPSDGFGFFMSPLKMLKFLIWDNYKFCLLKALVVSLLLMLMGLFFYSMPGYMVKKMFGA